MRKTPSTTSEAPRIRFLCVLAIPILAACAESPGADPPPTVVEAVASLAEICTVAEGKPRADDAVRRVDLNGDAVDDFVIYAGWMICEGAWSVYGDREKALTVYAGDGRGAAPEVFVDVVYDAAIETTAAGAALWLGVSAEGCGRSRAETFAEETFCDRAIVWNADTRRFDYAPLETIRLIE
jgi:hypothetical protein